MTPVALNLTLVALSTLLFGTLLWLGVLACNKFFADNLAPARRRGR